MSIAIQFITINQGVWLSDRHHEAFNYVGSCHGTFSEKTTFDIFEILIRLNDFNFQ